MNSPSSSSPDTVEAGLAAEPLRALRRGLARADGFALYVAVVKTPAQRNQLIALLAEAMPGVKLQTVILRAESTDILDELQKQLGGKPTGPVMVAGLEAALPSDAQNHPILNALNLRRTDWPQLAPQPVVFWVAEYLLGVLARSAPDFLDWRSDTLHFPELNPASFRVLQSATWGRGVDTRMSADARLERIKELESRLLSNEHPRDPRTQLVVADWLNELGLHLMLLGKNQDAVGCFRKLHLLAGVLGQTNLQGAALGNLGIAYSNLGNTRKATACHEHALKIARESGDRLSEAQELGNLANACQSRGDFHKAIKFYEGSMKLHRELGDRRGEGMSLGNLGLVYASLGQPQKAVEFYEKQIAIVREMGDRRGEASALQNLGNACADLGNTTKTLDLHEHALTVFRDLGDRRGEGAVLSDLGTVYAESGDNHKALEFYQKALAIARQIGDRRVEGYALGNISVAFNQLGDGENAVTFAEAALKTFEAIEDPYAANIRATLAELRKQAGLA